MAVYYENSVREWRVKQFREMGFNKPMARLLALSRTDAHQARKMIEQGCPHETLTAIFLDGDEREHDEEMGE